MKPDIWITPEQAAQSLEYAGYTVEQTATQVHYRKTGIIGSLTIHPQGVDGWAVMRKTDRGS